jgi:hypothetical protein
MGGLVDGITEVQVTGLMDINIYAQINDRKNEFLNGRFVSWTQKVE